RDGRAGEPAGDRDAPFRLQALVRKPVNDTLFTPDAVAVRPEPLRPVVCPDRRRDSQREDQQQDFAAWSERANVPDALFQELANPNRSSTQPHHRWFLRRAESWTLGRSGMR